MLAGACRVTEEHRQKQHPALATACSTDMKRRALATLSVGTPCLCCGSEKSELVAEVHEKSVSGPCADFPSHHSLLVRSDTIFPSVAMAPVKPSVRQFSACFRCVRGDASFNGASRRFLSSSAAAREELQTTTSSTSPPPPPPAAPAKDEASSKETPDYMKKWGELDPNAVEQKRDERRLVRREGIQPIGSRRRRAIIARSAAANADELPFEQLPYQCFQEARKVLQADRQEKLNEIKTQISRIKHLEAQGPAVSGSQAKKETRLRSMQNHLNDLIIYADINDPAVKKKFEDGQGTF